MSEGTVSESTVSNTELSEFFCCPHRVPGRELSEFLSAYYLCDKANSPSFSQNSPSLPQNSVRLSEFSRPKQYSRNSIPPVSYNAQETTKDLETRRGPEIHPGTKKQPQEEVFRPDILQTSGGHSRGYSAPKLRSGPSKPVLKRCVPKTLAFAFGLRLRSKTRCFKTHVLGRKLLNGKPQERLRFRALRSKPLAAASVQKTHCDRFLRFKDFPRCHRARACVQVACVQKNAAFCVCVSKPAKLKTVGKHAFRRGHPCHPKARTSTTLRNFPKPSVRKLWAEFSFPIHG